MLHCPVGANPPHRPFLTGFKQDSLIFTCISALLAAHIGPYIGRVAWIERSGIRGQHLTQHCDPNAIGIAKPIGFSEISTLTLGHDAGRKRPTREELREILIE